MPLYASRPSNSAVVPARDQNAPPVNPGVTIEEPAFLEDLILRLGAVRKQLSNLFTKYCGPRMSMGMPNPYDPDAGTAIEQQLEYQREKTKLEIEEAALVAQINNYAYVASLSVNDHDVDDVASEAHGAIQPEGGDVPGSKDRT